MIERALQIEGWMTEIELTWLAQQAAKHQTIVEIGSYLGRSTRALADNTEGVVYAVDYWLGPTEVCMAPWEREKLYGKFCENMADLIEAGKVIPVKSLSQNVKLDVKPDMVFIDGDHAYESVKGDIERWEDVPFLCGHDVDFPGVRKALEEVDWRIEIIEGTMIWRRVWHRNTNAVSLITLAQ